MTTSYRKVLERSQHGWRRILRKPAWDCNRFVCEPRQAMEVPHPHAGSLGWVLDAPSELTGGELYAETASNPYTLANPADASPAVSLRGLLDDLFTEALEIFQTRQDMMSRNAQRLFANP